MTESMNIKNSTKYRHTDDHVRLKRRMDNYGMQSNFSPSPTRFTIPDFRKGKVGPERK